MVSNNTTIVPAERADPLLVNPWGLASSATSPWWPANQGSNTSTITPATNIPNATRANVPGGPTGVVAGAGGTNFPIPGPPAGASNFIFNTLGGEIRGWRGGIPNNDAQLGISRASVGAVYMGLTIATPSAAIGPRLYAADFANNRIDIVNAAVGARRTRRARSWTRTCPPATAPTGSRRSATASSSRTPRKAPTGIRERPGAGLGVVNAFDLNGNFLARIASPGGVLNAPWGTALAPANFGFFGGDLLIGNFGDGRINAFRENADGTWTSRGPLKGNNGQPLFIGGLWALQFGKGTAANGALDQLFFTAGPNGERAGLFGRITSNLNEGIGDVSGTVPATLSLTMGPSAAFGTFVPAVANVYNASTTANVITSSLGSTLSVADPSPFATGHLINGTFSLRAAAPDRGHQRRRHGRRVRDDRRLVGPDLGPDLPGPDPQRHGDAELPAADRGHRPAPHRPVQQDAHLHAVHDAAVARQGQTLLGATSIPRGRTKREPKRV